MNPTNIIVNEKARSQRVHALCFTYIKFKNGKLSSDGNCGGAYFCGEVVFRKGHKSGFSVLVMLFYSAGCFVKIQWAVVCTLYLCYTSIKIKKNFLYVILL